MGKKKICQLLTYDNLGNEWLEESTKYFAQHFKREEIQANKVSWLNFHSIENKEEISSIFSNLNINDILLEDVHEKDVRPKIEEYTDFVFFSIRSLLPNKASEHALKDEQISFILGDSFLISLQQQKGDHFGEVRGRIEQSKGIIRDKGSDFLLYRLLEAIVDNYYEVLDDIVTRSERLESKVLTNPTSTVLKSIESEKRRLAELRTVALPMRDMASRMEKSVHACFKNENSTYFSDLLDYCRGVLEEVDATKTVLDGQINLYFAVQGQKMNEIMKVLTIVSSIFIPLTFLAGIYGMNFDHIPELHDPKGYFKLLWVMLGLGILLVLYFMKKGWLKRKG